MADPTMANQELIDLRGDITLAVGEPQVRIRVSKALLSLVSEYFRGLLGPRFAEGEAANAGKDIVLKDDNTKAFVTLMKLLHIHHDFPMPLSPVDLLALAVVTDKYGCVQALRLTFKELFPPSTTGLAMSEVYDLVSAAYIFDHPALFQTFTKSLLQDFQPGLKEVQKLGALSSQVPPTVWLLLENRRSRIQENIFEMVCSLLRSPCPNGYGGACNETRKYEADKSKDINSSKLMPICHGKTVLEILHAIESLNFGPVPSYLDCSRARINHQFATKTTIEPWVAEIRELLKPICLDCIKAGRLEFGGGAECRIPH